MGWESDLLSIRLYRLGPLLVVVPRSSLFDLMIDA